MEASLHHMKTRNFFSSLPQHKLKDASIPSPNLTIIGGNHLGKEVALAAEYSNCTRGVVKCGKWGSAWELERDLEKGKGEEWIGMGRWRDKCGGKGVVELLECLEREAIMGEDHGKDPTDYNRRALIFDQSSRVFQALKQHSASTHQP